MPVVRAERSIGVVDLAKVVNDAAVEADLVAGVTTQVTTEMAQALVVLLECNDLSFDFADVFGDDSKLRAS